LAISLNSAYSDECNPEINYEWPTGFFNLQECWADLDPSDTLGRNLLQTPEVTLRATALITTGEKLQLGFPYSSSNPSPSLGSRSFDQRLSVPEAPGAYGFLEQAVFSSGLGNWGTQFDGFGHVFFSGENGNINRQWFYNNISLASEITGKGLRTLGVDNLKPFFTTAYLLDIAAVYTDGDNDELDAGEEVTIQHILDAFAAQGLSARQVRTGDVVLLYTGWGRYWYTNPALYGSGEPGVSPEAAIWLADRGISILGADLWGMDPVFPNDLLDFFFVHSYYLVCKGIYLHENLNLEPWINGARAGTYPYKAAFFYNPTRMSGAPGAIGEPVVIF